MQPFDHTWPCPKCGALDWHRNWMPARPLGIYVSCHDIDQNREEHIHSRCKVCSYEYDALTRDTPEPPPLAPKCGGCDGGVGWDGYPCKACGGSGTAESRGEGWCACRTHGREYVDGCKACDVARLPAGGAGPP
jgi:predicted nucleic-acid-binding Zn-ribbon protein